MSEEQDIFLLLGELCRRPGFAHAIAFCCYRDNFFRYGDSLSTQEVLNGLSQERLLRIEISTLLGLMVQGGIDYALQTPIVSQMYIDRSESLLCALHEELKNIMLDSINHDSVHSYRNTVFEAGAALREPIFYGSESAYDFQYSEFAIKKYQNDNNWLKVNRGFTIEEAIEVVCAIDRSQEESIADTVGIMSKTDPVEWTLLPCFIIGIGKIVEYASVGMEVVTSVLKAFTNKDDENNNNFKSLQDYNIINSTPLLKVDEDRFILFQRYSLVESIYESPFYWMENDKKYKVIAEINRGRFTENVCKERLELVFGDVAA